MAAGVDLHQIVDQSHFEYPVQVHMGAGAAGNRLQSVFHYSKNSAVWLLWRPSRDKPFNDDGVDFITVHSRRELVQPTAVELHAAYIVIGRLSRNGVPMLLGKAMADLLLVQERVHLLAIIP